MEIREFEEWKMERMEQDLDIIELINQCTVEYSTKIQSKVIALHLEGHTQNKIVQRSISVEKTTCCVGESSKTEEDTARRFPKRILTKVFRKTFGKKTFNEAVSCTTVIINMLEEKKIEIKKAGKFIVFQHEVLKKFSLLEKEWENDKTVLSTLRTKYEHCLTTICDLEVQETEYKMKLKEQDERIISFEQELRLSQEEVERLEDEKVAFQIELKAMKAKISEESRLSEQKMKEIQIDMSVVIEKLNKSEVFSNNLERKLREREKDVEELQRNDELREKVEELRRNEQELQRNEEELREKAEELRRREEMLQRNEEVLREKAEELRINEQELQRKNEHLVDELRRNIEKNKNRNGMTELANIQSILVESRNESISLKKENECLKLKLNTYLEQILDIKEISTGKICELREEMSHLNMELEMERSISSKYYELKDKLNILQEESKQDLKVLQFIKAQVMKSYHYSVNTGIADNLPSDKSNVTHSSPVKLSDGLQDLQEQLHQTLDGLAVDAKERKSMLFELKDIKMERLLRSKKKTIYKERRKIEMESQLYANKVIVELKKKNEELILDLFACKEENTKLAKIVKDLEEKSKILNGRVEENSELKTEFHDLKEKYESLQKYMKKEEESRKEMEYETSTLMRDVEWYKNTVNVLQKDGKHCCIELKTRKEELERRLLHLEEQLSRIKIKYEEAVQNLADSREAMKNHHEVEKELLECKAMIKIEQVAACKEDNEVRSKENPIVNVQLHFDQNSFHPNANSVINKKIQEDIEKLQNALQELQCGTDHEVEQRNIVCDSNVDQNIKECDELTQKKVGLKSENKQLQAKVTQLEMEAHKSESIIEDLNNTLKAKNEQVQARITQLETEASQSEKNIDYLNKTIQDLEKCAVDNELKLTELREELEKVKTNGSENLKKDLEMMKYKIVEMNTTKKNNESVIVKLKEDKGELIMTVDRLNREVDNLKQKVKFNETER